MTSLHLASTKSSYPADPKLSDLPLDFDCTPEEVSHMLRSLKPPGPDEISVWMLCTFAGDIAPSVSALFNVSIAQGLLPADWKLSNIVPFPKEPGKQDIHFFYPISLLPVVGKVLKRHLH